MNLAIYTGNNMQIIIFRLKQDQNVHTEREREKRERSRKIFIILIIRGWSGQNNLQLKMYYYCIIKVKFYWKPGSGSAHL